MMVSMAYIIVDIYIFKSYVTCVFCRYIHTILHNLHNDVYAIHCSNTISFNESEVEDKFIELVFEMGDVQGLTLDEMKKYNRYIADRRLISMGMRGIFKVKRNPLLWVEEMINAPTHTNFFENRSTDYARGALKGNWGDVWK